MEAIIFEPLRWMDESARVCIINSDRRPKTYFQMTGRSNAEVSCLGRPVEELPRMLTILSPAHHIVSAMALDRMFNVEPPPLAANMREALLQTLFLAHHLRKLYFLLSSMKEPFLDYRTRVTPETLSVIPHHMLDKVMDHLALAQEAAEIFGGRVDHPLSAVTGGVGRFLKEPHYGRISEIARECLDFAVELAAFFRERVFSEKSITQEALGRHFPPMPALTMTDGTGSIVVRDPGDKAGFRFDSDKLFDKVGIHSEPWTYKPFAYLKEKGWNSLEADSCDGLFFVGPLARLNDGLELRYQRAEEERLRLIDALGPFPHFSVVAAYRSLVVELVQGAERLTELCVQEKLTGPAIRTIPSQMNCEAFAAVESPRGVIAHHYETDERGIVKQIRVLDTSVANNALRCLLVRNVVDGSKDALHNPKRIKERIETSLLPF